MKIVGVDVGGTFTDLILLDADSGSFSVAKVASTPQDQSEGFMAGLGMLGEPPGRVHAIVHGTTVATNAVLERRGARCGLITTRGFRDILELGRRTRPKLYGLTGVFEPIIPRELRFEVTERISAQGEILLPLDESEVESAVRDLLAEGVEAVVIHFLNSHVNDVHEQDCAAIVRRVWPNDYVTAGSQILPEIREFERGSTAALNGYVQPVIDRYVRRLTQRLADASFGRDLLIMQGNGGTLSAGAAMTGAVQTIMSGPAAGVIAAANIAREAGLRNLVTCDMGGTSFDVALIWDGEPAIVNERDLEYSMPIRVPMVDIHTIGAGGGSIARVNAVGLLQVGPESAGSFPGPVCYGRGGEEPTITDANLVLGRVDPSAMPGMDRARPREEVATIIAERIGAPLGLDGVGAARSILAIANQQMANAIRLKSVALGRDPRDLALFAFGGAGPLHAVALARELGIPTIIIPRFPGINSALGCAIADLRYDFVQHVSRPLAALSGSDADAIFAGQKQRGIELIEAQAADIERMDALHEIDLLYEGQTHLFRIAVDSPGFDSGKVAADFAEVYFEHLALRLPEMRVMAANLRTAVFGRRPGFPLGSLRAAGDGRQPSRSRQVWFEEGWAETPLYQRDDLRQDQRIDGPAIVEQTDTTILIEPGCAARVDRLGNILIEVSP